MKFLTVAVVFVVIAAASAMWTEEQEKEWGVAKKACAAEFNVDLDELKKSKEAGTIPEDDNTKKFLLCTVKQVGIMNEHGDFVTDRIKTMLTTAFPEEAENLLAKCTEKKDSEPTETAYFFTKCIFENTMKHHHH